MSRTEDASGFSMMAMGVIRPPQRTHWSVEARKTILWKTRVPRVNVTHTFQPFWSPDGRGIAWVENTVSINDGVLSPSVPPP